MNAPSNFINNISIDSVIFGYAENELKILLIKREVEPSKGMFALPGGFIHDDEQLDHAAVRILKEHTGVEDIYLEQARAFGEVERFPLRRVITIAYFALIKIGDYGIAESENAEWFSMSELPDLPFDHERLVKYCFDKLKKRIRVKPIGFNLLPEKFSLTEFQNLYEVILETELDKRNFRKKLLKMNLLTDLNEKQQNVAHRAAKLYKFDEINYEKLKTSGFSFDI